jgi:hypothetical protein
MRDVRETLPSRAIEPGELVFAWNEKSRRESLPPDGRCCRLKSTHAKGTLVANNRKATCGECARQEKARKPSPHLHANAEIRELVSNCNWLLGLVRGVAESEEGRMLLERLGRLAGASFIIKGLTLDSEGWAALLGLKNGRSFSKVKMRRQVRTHKPGRTVMFSAEDLLSASAGDVSRDRLGQPRDSPTR